MISFSSLPGTKSAADCNPKEIQIARETYEYACLLSVALCAALPAEERGSDDQGIGPIHFRNSPTLQSIQLIDFSSNRLCSAHGSS